MGTVSLWPVHCLSKWGKNARNLVSFNLGTTFQKKVHWSPRYLLPKTFTFIKPKRIKRINNTHCFEGVVELWQLGLLKLPQLYKSLDIDDLDELEHPQHDKANSAMILPSFLSSSLLGSLVVCHTHSFILLSTFVLQPPWSKISTPWLQLCLVWSDKEANTSLNRVAITILSKYLFQEQTCTCCLVLQDSAMTSRSCLSSYPVYETVWLQLSSAAKICCNFYNNTTITTSMTASNTNATMTAIFNN